MTALRSVVHVVALPILGILSAVLSPQVVEAGWRSRPPSRGASSPLSAIGRWSPGSIADNDRNEDRGTTTPPRHHSTPLFGIVRGGGVADGDDDDDDVADEGEGDGDARRDASSSAEGGSGGEGRTNDAATASPSSSSGVVKSEDDDGDVDDHDDERYSRQMYALGARAHGQIRGATAVLDGPLGGRSGRAAVPSEGADGFEGLGTDGSTSRSETPSGLLYEIAKNLALSGVGRMVLVRDDCGEDGHDAGYFDGSLDDLGTSYRRAALAEICGGGDDRSNNQRRGSDEEEGDSDISEEEGGDAFDDGTLLLAEFVRRLNPGVRVDVISRSVLLTTLSSSLSSRDGVIVEDDEDAGAMVDNADESDDDDDDIESVLGANPVVVSVDRSIASQLETNDACRRGGRTRGGCAVPFVSVETAGVHARVFCDFGPRFVVVDEDGENPRSTLLDRVVVVEEEVPTTTDGGGAGSDEEAIGDDDVSFAVHCLEGERHDVSKGDVIEFQGEQGRDGLVGKGAFPKCQVTGVKSPTLFTVKIWDGRSPTDPSSLLSSSSLDSLLEGQARSFSRVKLPKQLAFSSLRDILQPSSSGEGGGESVTSSTGCCDDDALFAPSDLDKSFDPVRRRAVMASMAALDAFVKKYGRLPSSRHHNKHGNNNKRSDAERFRSLVSKMTGEEDIPAANLERWESLIDQFARTCRGKFAPIQALSGALGAQEVLKAASGLYNPVRQFLLYDCDEVLNDPGGEADDGIVVGARNHADVAPGQSYVIGRRASERLARSRLFLVGAGAIGCELLKNLAAMGAGTSSRGVGLGDVSRWGRVVLTDMDTIEKSNLSRQLLFRDHDVGEFKSVAARSATLRFNPKCRVEAHTSRVGDEEDGPFDDDFWSSGCDVVMNALDNVEARLFVDGLCVAHGLGLIDAGTLGPKGNVQVVIPHQSESYGSSADPPEPDIPVCTLKNFPYEVSHTIQWARDLFDGYFSRRPRQANDHVDEVGRSEDLSLFARTLIEKLGDDAALDMAGELGEDLGFFSTHWDSSDPEYASAVRRDSLNWAIREAHRLFYVSMDELLQKHPRDSLDDDDVPFWSGTRRAPRPLRFIPLDSEEDEVSAQQVIINERIAEFVRSAARLRMESLLPAGEDDEESSISLEEALIVLDEQAKLLYKKKKSKEILHNLSGGGSSNDGDDTLSLIVDKLNGAKTGASFLPRLRPADFEKDDESNGHVAFVTAASNLRATSYGIPPADAMETRRVAGRIVPAMITTTGLVSALSCLELVKMLKGLPSGMHRNAFVNLALPFFAFTAPVPAEEVDGVNGKTHTIWDRITIKGSSKSPTRNMTLRKFLKKILKKAGCGDSVEVASISYGPYMIYANFLNSHDEELLETPLLDSVKDSVISEDGDDDDMALLDEDAADKEKATVELTGEQQAILTKLERKRFIDFSVSVEDQETGEEFELPPVRLIKDRTQQ